MRITLNINNRILAAASRLSGIREKNSLVQRGLEALIAQESSRRLGRLGRTEKFLRPVFR